MNFYFSAPLWEEQHDAPNTSKTAKAGSPKTVHNARVIVIRDATYRGASISGTFCLAEDVALPLPRNGWHKVQVYCRWFDLRLKTRGLMFKVHMSTAEVNLNYSGPVFTNIDKT
jgi:hypothetical protein